ncbi:MAG: SGNH/GDSL hydrolase family protein [Pseudomonadota bacterium]
MTAISPFSRIIYFGDSLTDSGTIFDLTSEVLTIPVPPAELGYDGQFSNGDVYADIAPALLGTNVENFGVGGARAIGTIPLAGFFPGNSQAPDGFNPFVAVPTDDQLSFDINLNAQVDRFLASEAARGAPIPGSAASFLIGLNDLNNFAPTSTDTDIIVQEALALSGTILFETLSNAFQVAFAGVETIILNTLPGATFFPSSAFVSPEQIALGEQIIPLYNFNLDLAVQVLQGSGIDARLVDLAALAAEIEADPTSFGFVADFAESIFLGFGSDPAILSDGVGGFFPAFPSNTTQPDLDADQIAFIDLLHPTTATHGIIGAFQAEALTNEVIFGTASADTISSGAGDDLLFGSGGNDLLRGGFNDDILLGGLGNDDLRGFIGNDIANGGSGNDIVRGQDGDDIVAGGEGDDRVLAGRGDDVLIDGLGSDRLIGLDGDDAFLYTEAVLLGGTTGTDSDLFKGGLGTDTLFLVLSDATEAAVMAEVVDGARAQDLTTLGLTTDSIENIVFLDSREDLTTLGFTRLEEADLWGLV